MTREIDEAIEMYTSNAEYERTHGNLQGCLDFKQLAEWLKDYKRLLEQEPSGDLISREAVEEIINDIRNCISVEGYWAILERMKKLPSVKPQTGHWIMQHRKVNTINYRTGEDVLTGEIHTVKELIRYECDEPYCSECGKRAGDTSGNYCCFCGARMESEQNG